MKTIQKPTEREYPYLAVMTFGDPIKESKMYAIDDIVIISLISEDDNDAKPCVQYVNGNKKGWATTSEKDYAPLPKGYEITLIQ